MGWTILDYHFSSTSPVDALFDAGALAAARGSTRNSSKTRVPSAALEQSVRQLNNKGERSTALHSRQLLLDATLESCRRTLNECEQGSDLLHRTTVRYEALLTEQRAIDDEVAIQQSFIKHNKLSAMADVCSSMSEQLEACELKGEGPREVKLDRRKSLLLTKSLTDGKGGPLTPGGTPSVQRLWPCGFHGSVDVEVDLDLAGLGGGGEQRAGSVVVSGRSGPLDEARAVAARRRRASWSGEELDSVSLSCTGEDAETQTAHRRTSSAGEVEGDDDAGTQLSLGSRQHSRLRAVVAFGAAVLPDKA